MPRGPNGEYRPSDAVGCAVMVAKIATRQIEDTKDEKSSSAPRTDKEQEAATTS